MEVGSGLGLGLGIGVGIGIGLGVGLEALGGGLDLAGISLEVRELGIGLRRGTALQRLGKLHVTVQAGARAIEITRLVVGG